MLFHTVPFFFLSMVAQKTSKLRYSDWLLRNFNQSESGYLSYHGEQNWGHHAKEHWKLVSKKSLHFVESSFWKNNSVVTGCIDWWFFRQPYIIFELQSDPVLRDRYVTTVGGIRVGRLVEDMDVFAVHLIHKHVSDASSNSAQLPFSIVTAMVDQVSLRTW